MEPWAVLAVGAFISSCASRNFAAIDLLKAPVQFQGKILGKAAVVTTPKWFPIDESYFESQAGLIYSRVKDLALPRRTQAAGDEMQYGFELSKVTLPPDVQSFTLTYFPWFRFLSEPISFDAVGQVAFYIANCFRFLLRSKGFSATLQAEGDGCVITTDADIRLEISGMASLRHLRIVCDADASLFDLANRRIELPPTCSGIRSGRWDAETPDRLLITATNEAACLFWHIARNPLMFRRDVTSSPRDPEVLIDSALADSAYVDSFGFEWTQIDGMAGKEVMTHGHVFGRFVLPRDFFAGKQVVDVGCGNGRIGRLIAPLCDSYIGVDLSEAVFAFPRYISRPRSFKLIQASGTDLPLADAVADAAICWGVLHHMDDPDAALSELFRITRPGGTILLYVYPQHFDVRKNLNHFMRGLPLQRAHQIPTRFDD
jgi:hypothetical protein